MVFIDINLLLMIMDHISLYSSISTQNIHLIHCHILCPNIIYLNLLIIMLACINMRYYMLKIAPCIVYCYGITPLLPKMSPMLIVLAHVL